MVQRDSGKWVVTFAAGLLGGLAFLLGMVICRGIGVSDLSLPLLFGSRLTGSIEFGAWIVGAVLLVIGLGVCALGYGVMFYATGNAGWRTGGIIGLAHWLLFGALLAIFTDQAELPLAPGFYAAGYGFGAFLELLSLFLLYGAIVGELMERAIAAHHAAGFGEEMETPVTPLADSLGQNSTDFEDYKRRNRTA